MINLIVLDGLVDVFQIRLTILPLLRRKLLLGLRLGVTRPYEKEPRCDDQQPPHNGASHTTKPSSFIFLSVSDSEAYLNSCLLCCQAPDRDLRGPSTFRLVKVGRGPYLRRDDERPADFSDRHPGFR